MHLLLHYLKKLDEQQHNQAGTTAHIYFVFYILHSICHFICVIHAGPKK